MYANQPPIDDDDDAEFELEPVDPEIIEMQRERARQKTDEAVARIDPDELFREDGEKGLGVDWESWKQFRFTTRHLLILTAILAMTMTLFQSVKPCSGLFLIGVIALGAGWYWVALQERRQAGERAHRREEFFASHGKSGEAAATVPAVEPAADAAPPKRFDVRFSYSLKELFWAVTAAAVVLGLIALVDADNMALVLGLVALAGLVVQASGVDPPRTVVLAWWVLLVLYLGVGLIAALGGVDSASRGASDQSRFAQRTMFEQSGWT